MNLLSLSLSVCVVFLMLGLFFFMSEERSFTYSLTKAICEGTTCRDYHITCSEQGAVISMAPLTGFVTFPSDWKDTRNATTLCR